MGPTVVLDKESILLDGRMVARYSDANAANQLSTMLTELQNNWKVLHPKDPFPGQCIVAVDASLGLAKVAPFVDTVTKTCPKVFLETVNNLNAIKYWGHVMGNRGDAGAKAPAVEKGKKK